MSGEFIDSKTNTKYSQELQLAETKLLQYAYTQLAIVEGQPRDTNIDYLLKIQGLMMETATLKEQDPELATPMFVRILGNPIQDFIKNYIAPLFNSTSPNSTEQIEYFAWQTFVEERHDRPSGHFDIPGFFNAVKGQMKLQIQSNIPNHVFDLFEGELITDHEKAGGVCGVCGSEGTCSSVTESISSEAALSV